MVPLLNNARVQAIAILLGLAIALAALTLVVVLTLRNGNTRTNLDAETTARPIIEALLDEQTNWGAIPEDAWWENPVLAQRKIVFTTHINPRSGKRLIEELLHLDQKAAAPIDLYVRTTGGWLDDAFSIHDTMVAMRSKVNVYAMGFCNSAGGIILGGATGRRYAFPDALIGIHASMADGPDRTYDLGSVRRNRFQAFWKKYAKLPSEWFPMTGNREYTLTPEEAIRYGVIDEVLPANPPAG